MKLISEKNPVDVFKQASDILYKAVAHTLGPAGLNSAIVYGKDIQSNPKFDIINDGKTIIDNLTSTDAEVACALQTIREGVLSTNSEAGDGTTSTIVITNALLNEVSKIEMTKFERCRQLKIIKNKILEKLPEIVVRLGDEVTLENVIETSLGSKEYIDLFKTAFETAGTNGKVLLEKSNNSKPDIEIIDGISFNQVGLIHELILDGSGNINKRLNECNMIVINEDIKQFNEVSKYMLEAKKADKPTIFVYSKMNNDTFRTMASNLLKDNYNFYPVTLNGYGSELSKYQKLFEKLAEVGIDSATFNKDALVLSPKDNNSISNYLYENKFNLSVKTVIVLAGAGNSITLEEQYRRFEDTIYSCANALKYGVCYGGGLTYRKLIDLVQDDIAPITDGNVIGAVEQALNSVYLQLLKNCDVGVTDNSYLPKLSEETRKYELDENYMAYDSYKVIEQVIENSFDIVISIFSTDILICNPQR